MTPENELPITSSTKQQTQKPLYLTNNSSTSRPFASSASKRSSVQALTSIEYLQHNYSKMGLQNSNINSFGPGGLMEEPEEMDDKENEREATTRQGDNSSSSNAGIMRKKINRGLRISSSTNQQEQQFQLNLPPTPTKPNMIRKLPWELKGNKLKEKKNVLSTKEIKLGIVDALNLVIDKWSLVYPLSSSSRVGSTISHQSESSDTSNRSTCVNSSTSSDIGVNFLKDLISSTTKAIRAIQHSIISLPPSLSHLDLFPSSTPSSSSNTNNNQNLRQLTLVVLGTIQSLRDTYKLQPASTSSTSSMMQGKGRATSTYDFSDDEKESENDEEDDEDIEQGIEYRNDITLEDLRSEKEIIREYVEVVDRILLRAVEKKKVTKVAGSDVVSTDSGLLIAEGNESEGLDKDFGEVEGNFLPIWARDGEFDNDLGVYSSKIERKKNLPNFVFR